MTTQITTSVALTRQDASQMNALIMTVAQSNLGLKEEQNKTMIEAKRLFDEIGQTFAAMKAENAALRAEILQLRGELNQKTSLLNEKVSAQNSENLQKSNAISSLSSRVTTLENAVSSLTTSIDKIKTCAHSCRGYIYAIYNTLWHNTPPTIPYC